MTIDKDKTFSFIALMAIFLLGAMVFKDFETLPKNHISNQTPYKGIEVSVKGVVDSDPVKKGHRIRIQIASEDFWYRNHLRTVEVAKMQPLPARNTVYHDAEHPSHLLLPIITDAPEVKRVEEPLSSVKWPL